MRGRPWLPEHDATLLQLRAAGFGVAVIAERLGRSKAAIESRVVSSNQGIAPKPIPPARDFLGEAIEARIHRLARLNGVSSQYIKRECYGWR